MPDTDQHDTDTPATDTPRPNTVTIRGEKGTSKARKLARTSISSEFGALHVMAAVNRKGGMHEDVELGALFDELLMATRDENATGTDRLMSQAIVLDRLFMHLAATAMRQEYVSGVAPALTLALRAQAQCRTTLQAVSDIRHPRQYVGTQNVGEQYNSAGGHQQVNRDAHGSTGQNRPNELSEGTANELHQNSGTPAGVEGAGDAIETVGARDRAANG